MTARTVVDLLRDRVQATPDRTAYTFLADGDRVTGERTWAGLAARARAVAAGVRVVAGERALLVFDESLEFLDAWYGCLWAGVLPVPVHAPDPARPERTVPRLRFLAEDAGVSVVLTTRHLAGAVASLDRRVVCVEDLPDADAVPNPGSLAYLQYTSGSTSDPKGVVVTHANLLHQLEDWHGAFGYTADDTVVSWLPATHDLGMVHGRLMAVYRGQRCVFFPPVTFVQRPSRWLRALSTFGGTHSASPNFGFDLAARRPRPDELEGVDLSRVRMILNGAEPIRRETMERFVAKLAPYGLRTSAVTHAFGMSEATAKICNEPLERGPSRFVDLDPTAYERNEVVVVARGTPNARTVASNGVPQLDTRVIAVDPNTRERLPEARVGELWVGGATVAAGYWHREEQTEATFHARTTDGDGPFLRTGDLGFVLDGEVFLSGRLKDVIIVRGQNHHPPDLERQLEAAHEAVRPGGTAVFSLSASFGDEKLGVVAEVAGDDLDLPAIVTALRQSLFDSGLSAATIALVPPRALPKTSSGKTQRAEARAQLLAGVLPILHRLDTL